MEQKAIPTKKAFNKIKDITDQINALYEEKDKAIKALVDKYGTGEWTTDSGNEDKSYLRLSITDNVVALCEGKKLWKPAGFDRFSVVLKELKNKPKEK